MALDFSTLTPEDLRQLAQAVQKSQLTALQDEMDKQQGARLHDEKNAPWAPGGYYEKALKQLPPNPSLTGKPREYPKMLYAVDYPTAQRAYVAAHRFREPRDQPGLRDQMIRDAQVAMQNACYVVGDAAEERKALETGLWAETPDKAKEAEERRAQAIAEAAAVSRHDDRRLSPAALAERDAIDAESEGHLVEVPEQRRGPGRPRKVEP